MIWLNPWAWLGILALGVPLLIHLLSRHQARVQKFPTLRFLDASPLLPTRRTRLSDPLLLAIRLGILAAAVAALARPVIRDTDRQRDLDDSTVRAIIVDTSASTRRSVAVGEQVVDTSRQVVSRGMVFPVLSPARALPGAVAWLKTQVGRREIVIVSDFQIGTIDSVDLAGVPAEVGITLTQVGRAIDSVPTLKRGLGGQSAEACCEIVARQAGREVNARVALTREGMDVEWSARLRPGASDGELLILAGNDERRVAEAAWRAARTLVAFPADTARPIAVVFRGYPGRDALMRDANVLNQAWMADVVAHARGDVILARAASTAETFDSTYGPAFTVVARNDSGKPAVVAARGNVEGRDRLLFFPLVDPGSLTSTVLIASLSRALTPAIPVAEQEPATLSAEALRKWERQASPASTRMSDGTEGPSDGRWLWILALLLLALETWVRRRPREVRHEVTLERVA